MKRRYFLLLGALALVITIKIRLETSNLAYEKNIELFIVTDMKTIMKHKTIPLQGTEVHYFSNDKQDAESILFLHPAFSDHSCFDNQIDFFAEHFNVITVDLLGHGLS